MVTSFFCSAFLALLLAHLVHAAPVLSHTLHETAGRALTSTNPDASIVTAPRSGSLPAVLRALISSTVKCKPDENKTCRVSSVNAFATVAESVYNFNDTLRNIKGRSTQSMHACRCLVENCSLAIVLRPVIIKDARAGEPRVACLYESVDGKFSDCHSEIWRVQEQSREDVQIPDSIQGGDQVNYTVFDDTIYDYWNVTGRRGWKRVCSFKEVNELKEVDLSKLGSSDVRDNERVNYSTESPCRPPQGIVYYKSSDADSKQCIEMYDRAVAVAKRQATQQDCFAVGKASRSYLRPSPGELVSDTELSLASGAVVLGLLVLWTMFRKNRKRTATRTRTLQRVSIYIFVLSVMFVQLLSFVLEALPLFVVMAGVLDRRRWTSLFSFVDACLATGKDGVGGVLIYTTILGEVSLKRTRLTVVAALIAVSVSVGLIIICVTALDNLRGRKGRWGVNEHEVRKMKKRNLRLSYGRFGEKKWKAASSASSQSA